MCVQSLVGEKIGLSIVMALDVLVGNTSAEGPREVFDFLEIGNEMRAFDFVLASELPDN